MRYRTIIFDLDGTLLDTLADLTDSVNAVLSSNGYPIRSLDEVRGFVGNGVGRLVHLSLPQGTPSQEEARCLEQFRTHYLTNMDHKTAPYPGILSMLDELNAMGCALAVVSNKFDGAVKALCQTYFGTRLAAAVGESEGVARKPAPDTVFRALELLNAPAEGAVYVGDSEVDLLTARNAGIPCISVSWGFRERAFLVAHGAVQVVARPAELMEALA